MKHLHTNIIAIVCIFTFFAVVSPREAKAQAACPYAGVPCVGVSDATKAFNDVLKNAKKKIKDIESSVKDNVKKLKKKVNDKIDKVGDAIVQANGGLSQAVTSGATTISKHQQKTMDTYQTKMVELDRRLAYKKIAADGQPTANDCIKVTMGQYEEGGDVVSEGVSDLFFENQKRKIQNLDGLNSIQRTAAMFQRLGATCDPSVPNAPEQCQETPFTNSDRDPSFLLSDSTVDDEAGVALDLLTDNIVPNTIDEQGLPSFDTAAGQRAYLTNEAQKVRSAFSIKQITKMQADRVGVLDTRELVTQMRERNIGGNAPQEILDYYQNKPNKVSMAEKRDLESESLLSVQNSYDAIRQTSGQSQRDLIGRLVDSVEREYEGLLEDRKKTIFMALEYADYVNSGRMPLPGSR